MITTSTTNRIMFEIARNGRVRAIEIVKSQKGFLPFAAADAYSRVDTNRCSIFGIPARHRAMCSRAILCFGLYAHSRIYFAISTDEHAIIHAIIVAGPTWLRPAKFLASASGIVNIKRRKQMTP